MLFIQQTRTCVDVVLHISAHITALSLDQFAVSPIQQRCFCGDSACLSVVLPLDSDYLAVAVIIYIQRIQHRIGIRADALEIALIAAVYLQRIFAARHRLIAHQHVTAVLLAHLCDYYPVHLSTCARQFLYRVPLAIFVLIQQVDPYAFIRTAARVIFIEHQRFVTDLAIKVSDDESRAVFAVSGVFERNDAADSRSERLMYLALFFGEFWGIQQTVNSKAEPCTAAHHHADCRCRSRQT